MASGLAIDTPIVLETGINPAAASDLVSSLDAIVVAAGWGSRTAITGGFKYTLTSSQLLSCKVKIYATEATRVGIQVLSTDESRVGYLHILKTDNNVHYTGYQAHASPSQLLISVRNNTLTYDKTAFQGGIPWVPNSALITACDISAGPGLATECWWSNGDSGTFNQNSFRVGHRGFECWSACYNGTLVGGTVSNGQDQSRLELNTVCCATNVDNSFGVRQRTRFFNGLPLRVEPLISWADSDGGVVKVRGMLYNSLINTLELPIEQELNIIDDETGRSYAFINYMNGSPGVTARYGSLILLKGTGVTSESGAYWYFH